ncbi:hypothetical protein NXF25_019393 [Crotalus adamanteus]|uniref:Uncharacterized protein n=1 Tax=Crotalus adamanteus TaxID=8729 RepID=A0AAW1B1V2_CROAD
MEREKFHHENKELVNIRFQLRGEKQQLSEQFEEELSR